MLIRLIVMTSKKMRVRKAGKDCVGVQRRRNTVMLSFGD